MGSENLNSDQETPHGGGISEMVLFGIASSALLLGALGVGASFWYRDWMYLKGAVLLWFFAIGINIAAGILMGVLRSVWRGVRNAV